MHIETVASFVCLENVLYTIPWLFKPNQATLNHRTSLVLRPFVGGEMSWQIPWVQTMDVISQWLHYLNKQWILERHDGQDFKFLLLMEATALLQALQHEVEQRVL